TYGRLLQDRDLALLARAAGLTVDGDEGVRALRSDPGRIAPLLRHPGLIAVLLGAAGPHPLLLPAPFLLFASLVPRRAPRVPPARAAGARGPSAGRPGAVPRRRLSGPRRTPPAAAAPAPSPGPLAGGRGGARRGGPHAGTAGWHLGAGVARAACLPPHHPAGW